MKLLIIVLCFLLAPTAAIDVSAQSSTILGKWEATDIEHSTVEVYEAANGLIYGTIIASDEEDWIGKVILREVRFDPTSETWEGEVYSLRMFFTVNVEISLLSAQKLKIEGRRFLMSKTFYWTRATPDP